MGFTIIDIYIIKSFIKNLLFALACFIIIFILVDLFESLDRFIDAKFGLFRILEFYYYFIAEIVKLITPVSMLLATLFTAGRMSNFNELIALKDAGISMARYMYPFFVVGVVVTFLSVYFNLWIVPNANKQKFSIERICFGRYASDVNLNKLYFQDTKNQLILIDFYDQTTQTAKNVSVLLYYPDSVTVLKKRIDAESMTWQDGDWVLFNALERDMTIKNNNVKSYETIKEKDLKDYNTFIINPDIISRKILKPDELNYSELKDYIENQKKGGHDVARAEVDFYSKISFPFSNLIVIIFGISITASSRRRKGLALQFGISILVSFVYLAFVKFSQAFGYNGDMNPILTAWLANIIFAAFGIINLYFKNY